MAEVYPSYSLALYDHLKTHGSLRCHAISVRRAKVPASKWASQWRYLLGLCLVELKPMRTRYGYRVSTVKTVAHSWSEAKIQRMARDLGDCVGWLDHVCSPERFAKSVCEKLGIQVLIDPASLSRILPWFDPSRLAGSFVVELKTYERMKLACGLTSSIPKNRGHTESLWWVWLTPFGAIKNTWEKDLTRKGLIEALVKCGICDRDVAVKALDGMEPEASLLYLLLKEEGNWRQVEIL